jgi:hypothetical protein
MSNVECRDIFNAVYVNVRGSYIESFYSSKQRTKTSLANSVTEDYSEKNTVAATSCENVRKEIQGEDTANETIVERVERDSETDGADKIGEDLEEKFPYDKEEHARWLYTAVTRASEKLVLVR